MAQVRSHECRKREGPISKFQAPCVGCSQSVPLSYSQYFLHHLMDMGSALGTIVGAILHHKRVPVFTLNGPLVKQIWKVGLMGSW